jgi:hypothetical protein
MEPKCDYLVSRAIPFGGGITRGSYIEEELCGKTAKHFYFTSEALIVGYSNKNLGYIATCEKHKTNNNKITKDEYTSAIVLES